MNTHNIQFYDNVRKFSLIIVFWIQRKNCVGIKNKWENHGKRVIRYRIFGVRLSTYQISIFENPYRIICYLNLYYTWKKKLREKSRECHNHKPQPFPDPKRKRKPTNPNKHKSNKRTKSTKISSLFPKRGNRNTKRTKKHKNKMTHGKTYNKSPRRINHKATKSKANTGTTALERSVD